MRKLAIAVALASTALATPALARDKAWYVGVEGGAMIVEDINFDIGAVPTTAKVNHNYGYDVDGVVGYDFGMFRVETEVGYRSASVDTLTASNTTLGNVDGKTSALSFMLNGMLDFGDDDGLQGFVGGGVGVARVKGKYALNTYGNFVDDSDTVFAWQAIAGIRAPLTKNIDATLKYRFFNAENVKLVDVTGRTLDGRFRSHSILGGFTFNFGGSEPPPPPVPVPPPPPPPEPTPPPPPAPIVVPCSPGPFIVFFEWDKSDITPEAASILDNAIGQYANCGNAQVMLAGHADRSGSAKYNVGLSQRRADAVKAYMVAHSVPDGVISEQAFGESRPRVETADGVREVQNRRVEITYGPSSGQ
jgi:outer membrane protein OmpA-like peptidoglycan-associated protein/opacity protein-like surface antigen